MTAPTPARRRTWLQFPSRQRTPGHIVIRQVVKLDRKGAPKIARDRKAHLELERITARDDRPCSFHSCPLGGTIAAGTAYAKATDLNKNDGPFIRGRRLPTHRDFHFECVWPEARPLVRFLTTHPEEGAS